MNECDRIKTQIAAINVGWAIKLKVCKNPYIIRRKKKRELGWMGKIQHFLLLDKWELGKCEILQWR